MEATTSISIKFTEEERNKLKEAQVVLESTQIMLNICAGNGFRKEIQNIVAARDLIVRLLLNDLKDDDYWGSQIQKKGR